MHPEALEAIEKRKAAADKWVAAFAETTRQKPVKGAKNKALAVIVLTKEIRDFLAEHDPMALRQAQEAFNGESYCDYLDFTMSKQKWQTLTS